MCPHAADYLLPGRAKSCSVSFEAVPCAASLRQGSLRTFAPVSVRRHWWTQKRANDLPPLAHHGKHIQLGLHLRNPRELHVKRGAQSRHLQCLLVDTVGKLAQFVQNCGCKRFGHISPEGFSDAHPDLARASEKQPAKYASASLNAVPFCTRR